MAKNFMTKVGELLDKAGLDEEIVKSITEKLVNEQIEIVADSEKENKKAEDDADAKADDEKEEAKKEDEKAEAKADDEKEEAKEKEEKADDDADAKKDEEKANESEELQEAEVKHEEAEGEGQEDAPVDPKANKGGYNAPNNHKQDGEDEVDDDEVAKVKDPEESEIIEALLALIKEAFERSSALREEFEELKEAYLELASNIETVEESADRIIEEREGETIDEAADRIIEERNYVSEEEKVEADDKDAEEAKDEKETEEEKADEGLEETAQKLAEGVGEISEELTEEAPKKVNKAFSLFESAEEAGNKERKAFTLFPNL